MKKDFSKYLGRIKKGTLKKFIDKYVEVVEIEAGNEFTITTKGKLTKIGPNYIRLPIYYKDNDWNSGEIGFHDIPIVRIKNVSILSQKRGQNRE